MEKFRCRTCWATSDVWQSFCPSCGVGKLIPGDTPAIARKQPKTLRRRLGNVAAHDVPRLRTGMAQVDAVFGGGIAVPSVIQFAGQPGIGKSTCLLQIVDALVDRALYCTSEERLEALAGRARRLHLPNADRIDAVATDQLDVVIKEIHETDARLVVIDSLQGLRKAADSKQRAIKHTQLVVRDIATELIDEAQSKKRTIILVSHVNKAGDLAGLKEIEHLVDTLLWFRGDRSGTRRYLMSEKNRFGRTDIQAHFVMTEHGLLPTQPPARRREGEEREDEAPQAEEALPPPPPPPAPPALRVVRPVPVHAEPMPERAPIRPGPVEIDGEVFYPDEIDNENEPA